MLIANRFRWAVCQLDALENCLEYRTLQNALASLPKTLDETYDRILRGIPEEHKQNATRILQFLTYSERPLRIEEAVDAIVVDVEADQHFNPKYRMPDPHEILCYCSSLVVVVPTKEHVYFDDNKPVELQLAHLSVKEYLTSNRLDKDIAQKFQEITAKTTIAIVCLAYLSHIDVKLPTKEIRQRFPLAQYSARFWMAYAAVAESKDETLQGFIRKFFCYHKNSYTNCYNLYSLDQLWNDKPASALYYASFGGLVNTVEYLLSQGADVNVQGGHHRNALQVASTRGNDKIVELLLSNGADVNAEGGFYGNALQAASREGHDKIVELLLSKGADINAQGGRNGNALQAASGQGHDTIVELLLSKGADVNAQDGYYGNALQAASVEGHTKIVELLLSKGADVNTQGGHYGNALHGASRQGYDKIVELLLSKGADVNAQGGPYGNALQRALRQGHDKIVDVTNLGLIRTKGIL